MAAKEVVWKWLTANKSYLKKALELHIDNANDYTFHLNEGNGKFLLDGLLEN